MSLVLYNAGVRAYGLGVRLASPFNAKAAQWTKGRQNLLEEIKERMSSNTQPVVWFHCASVGEFEQGRPLMEAFRQKYPGYKIMLTFFSPSGYELRKNYAGADYVFYLPLDTEYNARCFVTLTKPKLAIFIKYEFWHHYTKALRKRNIPLLSVSAIFRPSQVYFKRGGFYRHILDRFSHIYTQNLASAQLLAAHDFTRVSTAGDTRVDRVLQTANSASPIPLAASFKGISPTLVIGSSWPQDLKVLTPFMQEQLQKLKFIIAPHEINESDLAELEKEFPGQTIRFSRATEDTVSNYRILLIDNVGMLSALYQYADYAYVGGAFGKGLHNTLEPAAFGPPIFFGPRYHKFQEAEDLVQLKVAFPVKTTEELRLVFEKLHQNPQERMQIKRTTQEYLKKQAGATDRILSALEYWLPLPQE